MNASTNAIVTTNAPVAISAKIGVRKLAHVAENFQMEFEGKTKSAIIAEINSAGFVLGVKSLAALLSGEKTKAGDFEVIVVKFTAEEKAAKKAAADAIKAKAKAEVEEFKIKAAAEKVAAEALAAASRTAPVSHDKGLVDMTPVAGHPQSAPVSKSGRPLIDYSAILPATAMPILRGSKVALMFEMLVQPNGATKQEMMDKFNWTEGGWGGMIHWEVKAKGYSLYSEKVDGVLHYHLHQMMDKSVKVQPNELVYRELKAAAVPAVKAPKAPKEVKVAAEPDISAVTITKRVRVTKEQLAQVPSAGTVTKRVAAVAKSA